jgi:hypothetical protein
MAHLDLGLDLSFVFSVQNIAYICHLSYGSTCPTHLRNHNTIFVWYNIEEPLGTIFSVVLLRPVPQIQVSFSVLSSQ